MCGRFTLAVEKIIVQQALGLETTPADLPPRYNIAPSQPVGVVTNDDPTALNFYKWGLVPFWAKDPAIGNKLINARSETAHEKPSFREALKQRRCLIPASGFYEWQARGKHKQPMYIHLKDQPIFAFAGLWETWKKGAEDIYSCVILTTEANDAIADLHHRMPVILHRDDYDAWLHNNDTDAIQALMKPYEPEPFAYYPVSTAVNKPENDSPANIRRIDDDSGNAQQLTFL